MGRFAARPGPRRAGPEACLAPASPIAMTDDKTLRAAKQFIERFGQNAPRQAALRAEELSAQGDEDGAAIWLRIGETVDAMLRDAPNAADQH
jgi:hypothetical protein